MTDDPISRDWILSELRAMRDLAERERAHVVQRFEEVNKLRDQVLQERGVFVRHEVLTGVSDRVSRLEQHSIERTEYERLAERVAHIERTGIPRVDLDGVARRVGKLEALGPIIVLVAGVIGAVAGGVAIRYFVGVGP